MKNILNWFKVEKTGESFWDSIAKKKVYVFRYKHNGRGFLSTNKWSLFRVELLNNPKEDFDIPLRHAYSDEAQIHCNNQQLKK